MNSDYTLSFRLDKETKEVYLNRKGQEKNYPYFEFFRQILSKELIGIDFQEVSSETLLSFILQAKGNQTWKLNPTIEGLSYTFSVSDRDKKTCQVVFCRSMQPNNQSDSSIDYLTKVHSRSYLFQEIEKKLSGPIKENSYLFRIDLDNFKRVNDSYGHVVGDACLKDIASKLNLIFSNQIFGRYGGDEFLAYVEEVKDIDKLILECLDIHYSFRKDTFDKNKVSCSVGIVSVRHNNPNFLSLVEKADTALYRAKREGKNLAAVYQGKRHYPSNRKKTKKKGPFSAKTSCYEEIFKEEWKSSKKKFFSWTFAFVCIFLILVSLVDAAFYLKRDEITKKNSQKVREEYSNNISMSIRLKTDESFYNLNSGVKMLEKTEDDGSRNYLDILYDALKDDSLINEPGILLDSGDVYFKEETISIYSSDLAKSIIQDKTRAIGLIPSLLGEEDIYFAVPFEKNVSQDTKIAGIVSVFPSNSFAQEIFSSIGSKNYASLIDFSGNKISVWQDSNLILFDHYSNRINYFQDRGDNAITEKFSSRVKDSYPDLALIKLEGTDYFVYISPVLNRPWKIRIIQSRKEASKTIRPITRYGISAFTVFSLFFLFFSTVLLVVVYQYKNKLLVSENIDPITQTVNDKRFRLDVQKVKNRSKDKLFRIYINRKRFGLRNKQLGENKASDLVRCISGYFEKECSGRERINREYSDHFLLLLQGNSLEERTSRVDTIVSNCISYTRLHQGVKVSFYVGIYPIDSDRKSPVWVDIDRARYACYAIPRSNNDYDRKVFDEERKKREELEIYIEQSQDLALMDNKFLVYYQGKYNLHTHRIEACEALLRWKDDNKGFIDTQTFVNVFENNGFIVRLDLYIFESVLKSRKERLKEGKEIYPVSVNLSRKHFDFKDAFAPYENLIRKYNIPGKYLEFEITESVILNSEINLNDTIDRIHAIGSKVSIDDFGSGFSNFSRINHIDYDILKIDKKLLYGKNGFDDYSKNILDRVIKLNKRRGKIVLCEGVETKEESDYLESIGCDLIQGYYYSKPADKESFLRLADERNKKEQLSKSNKRRE